MVERSRACPDTRLRVSVSDLFIRRARRPKRPHGEKVMVSSSTPRERSSSSTPVERSLRRPNAQPAADGRLPLHRARAQAIPTTQALENCSHFRKQPRRLGALRNTE